MGAESAVRDGSTLATRWSMLDQLRGENHERAWEWFLERYRPVVWCTLERLVGSRVAAEIRDGIWGYLYDSPVFERADRRRRFRHYLRGTIRNYALEQLRDRAGAGEPFDETSLRATDDSPADAETRVWADHALELSLRRLDDEHPDDALALRRFYGLRDAERWKAPDLAR